MKKKPDYVFGIDTSKHQLDFYLLKGLIPITHKVVNNNTTAIKSWLLKTLKQYGIKLPDCHFCIEQTGIYCNPLITVLLEMNAIFSVENAMSIKLSGGLTRGKDDKVDAHRIVQYGVRYADRLTIYQPKRNIIYSLDELDKLRKKLMVQRNSHKLNQREKTAFLSPSVTVSTNKHIDKVLEFFDKQIKAVEKDIEELIESDEHLKWLMKLICSVPDVGKITARAFIIITNEFKNGFSAKQMACYCGVAPFKYQSGKSLKYKDSVSHKANKKMKTLLHLCAVSVGRTNSDLGRYYKRKLAEGKHKMSALNAVRNKIIHRVFAVVIKQKMYDNNYNYAIAA